MAPKSANILPAEHVQLTNTPLSDNQQQKFKIIWINVLKLIVVHGLALNGLWIIISQSKYKWFLYQYLIAILYGMGITGGAHRLWSHRAYEAKLPLRILLMILQTVCLQTPIYEWSREHRVHHKFTDTDADPHNATRGFFFSHMGWLMVKKHNDVLVKGKTVDLSDLEADPVVMFQKKYYAFAPIISLIPCIIPWYFWGETWWDSFFVAGALRYVLMLHYTWSVNSVAHMFGSKPYNKDIKASETMLVSFLTNGEGWHNYHHVFPWDYKAAEFGIYHLSITTIFINLMAKIGLAYNLKTASPQLVKKRAQRTGDGSWVESSSTKGDNVGFVNGHHEEGEISIWGWGDKDMKAEDVDVIKVYENLKEK